MRSRQSEIACRCGYHIDLTAPLARYRFICPYCEKETWGRTNLEDPEITEEFICRLAVGGASRKAGETLEDVIKRAEEEMYRNKHAIR